MKKPSPPSSGLRRRSPSGSPARVAGGEGGGARLVLAGEQRAGGVDQTAAGLRPGGGRVEDGVLERRVAGELLGRQPPLALGLAAPGAGARAGGVDEHQVADRLQRRDLGVGKDADLGAGAAGAVGQVGHPARVGVPGEQPAAALHGGGERQRLAAAAGAIVEHGHPRPGGGDLGDQLARGVLQLDHAGGVGAARGDEPRVAESPAARAAPAGARATCTPSRASTTVAASALVFRVLTRRSTGARACIARSTGSKSGPSDAASSSCRKSG